MKSLAVQPNLVELVQDAIVAEIASGQLAPGARIIQEQIAKDLGVSRQPVQQALLLLRNLGVLSEAPGRGLQRHAARPGCAAARGPAAPADARHPDPARSAPG